MDGSAAKPGKATTPGKPTTPRKPTSLGRRLLRWSLELGALGLCFTLLSAWQTRNLLESTSAPSFELTSLQGSRVNLESFRGKTVLIHFWATWCGVCRQEFSALNHLHNHLDPNEALLSIVADTEDPAALAAFVRENAIEYPVLLATPEVLAAYQVSAFPTNYYLDSEGTIQDSTVGLSNRFAMSARLGCSKR